MRDIKTLLNLLLTRLKEQPTAYLLGLCALSNEMYTLSIITYQEHLIIKAYLKENRPFNFKAIFFSGGYWWTPINESHYGKKPRIKYLEKLIKKLG